MKQVSVIVMMLSMLFAYSTSQAEPEVNLPHVHSVHLKSFSAVDKEITFYLAFFNSNDFPMKVTGADGDLKLNQLNIGKFDQDTEYMLSGGAMKTVIIPITLDTDVFKEAAQTVLAQSKAEYQLGGNAKTQFGNVQFSDTGDLPVQNIMSEALR